MASSSTACRHRDRESRARSGFTFGDENLYCPFEVDREDAERFQSETRRRVAVNSGSEILDDQPNQSLNKPVVNLIVPTRIWSRTFDAFDYGIASSVNRITPDQTSVKRLP